MIESHETQQMISFTFTEKLPVWLWTFTKQVQNPQLTVLTNTVLLIKNQTESKIQTLGKNTHGWNG